MSLSIQKLIDLLVRKRLFPRRYFALRGFCVYIELLVVKTADILLLYIPEKYKIKIQNDHNVFNIEYVQLSDEGTVPGDYTEEPENIAIENKYQEIRIDDDDDDDKNIEDVLENNYNRPLDLKNIGTADLKCLKETFRQLKRLKLCVKNLRYKLCIQHRNYMQCIRPDDTFEVFSILEYTGKNISNLFITTDLESVFTTNNIEDDVKTVRQGVYKILDINQTKHVNTMEKILENKLRFLKNVEHLRGKKQVYTTQLKKLEDMLSKVQSEEIMVREEIKLTEDRYRLNSSFQGDIEKTHIVNRHKEKLSTLMNITQEITDYILKIKFNLENISLKLDKTCFDNTVMIDTILQNFVDVSEL